MKGLNILMSGGLVPWHPGAYGGYIANFKLAEAIAKAGHNVDYVAIAPKNLRREIDWGHILYLPPASRLVLPLLQYFKTATTLSKYDIVYTDDNLGYGYGIHRRMFRNIRLVIAIHAPELRKFPRGIISSSLEPCNFILAHSADMIFCPSEFTKKNISEAYSIPLSKIRVIYGGVDDFFLSSPIAERRTDIFSLLFVVALMVAGSRKGWTFY